jgi:signal transduction histidine kinase
MAGIFASDRARTTGFARAVVVRGSRLVRGGLTWSPLATATGLLCCGVLYFSAAHPGEHSWIGLCAVVPVVALNLARVRSRMIARRHDERLREELDDAIARAATLEQSRREQLHDARTAVLALNGASRLLCRPDGVPAETADRLQRMMTAELQRLQDVLAGQRREPIREFDLADAIAPVIWAHELHAGPITTDVPHTQVIGRPEATATALANLLANTRVHAPGASVCVRVETNPADDAVSLVVEDDGPGIPAVERERVLRPGVRATTVTAAGSGIGLYTAASAMRDQNGTLRVSARAGGGTCVVMTLPAAGRLRTAEPDSGPHVSIAC